MPPKSSSPTKSKTIGAFFGKDESAAKSVSAAELKALEPAIKSKDVIDGETAPATPEKPKRKRASRAKRKETPASTQPTPGDSAVPNSEGAPSKASSRPKGKPAMVESVSEVLIPLRKPQETGATAQTDNEKSITLVETIPSPFLVDSKDIKESKDILRSPSKTASAAATVGGTSTNLSKLNKIDTASMLKVRNGKAQFTENKLKFSAHPSAIADLCRFHEYRETLQETEDLTQFIGVTLNGDHLEITSIPTEHHGLIAKLVEESDLVLSELATSMTTVLCPVGFEAFEDFAASLNSLDGDTNMDVDVEGLEEKQAPVRRSATTVSASAIMEAIQSVAQRVNYGVPVSNLPGPVATTPPNLSVYRWEVVDIDRHFPSDMRAAVTKRRGKRMEASAALTAWFLGLDAKQQEDLCPIPVSTMQAPGAISGIESESLISPKKSRVSMGGESMDVDGDVALLTSIAPDATGVNRSGAVAVVEDLPTVAAAVDPAVIEFKLKEVEAKKKEAEAKEERRLEKERKMAERQLEKDQKEAERLQKEEAKKRKAEEERLKKEQTSMRFMGFFKPIPTPSVKKDTSQICVKSEVATSSLSELFHPFHVKKYTTLAPINRFVKGATNETIDSELNINVGENWSAEESSDMDIDVDHDVPPVLEREASKEALSMLFTKRSQPHDSIASQQRKKRLPQRHRRMTVPEVMQSGLLVQDEENDVNFMLTWRDIPSLRMRLLQFVENYRPAYYGTWSKQSKAVSGRRFLGKDTNIVDYDFDSEAEWEEDEEGEECKSDDDEEDAEDVGSDQDEEDDWLVPEGYLSDDEGLDAGEEGGADMSSNKKSKELRRPTLAQMTPIIVGPVFEMVLGECSSHPALEPYHIEFIGDYGVGMDMYHAVETSALVVPLPSGVQV